MYKEESNRGETKTRDSKKKKQAQTKKNDNRATQDIKVQEGNMEGKCVTGLCLTRAQAKNPPISFAKQQAGQCGLNIY